MCFVAKSPQPTTRVFGLGNVGIAPEDFENEVLPLVAMPDGAMHYRGLEEGDAFYLASRGRIRGQTWTWIGRYRHATDPGGREGAYVSAGILLLNQICRGEAVASMIGVLDDFVKMEVLDTGRIRTQWKSINLSPWVMKQSFQTDNQVRDLMPDLGLSITNDRLIYIPGNDLAPDRLVKYLDGVQTEPRLQSYGRAVFGPSAQFAEKLREKPELEVFTPQTGPAPSAGSRHESSAGAAVGLQTSQSRGAAYGSTVSSALPPRPSEPHQAHDERTFDRALHEIKRDLSDLRIMVNNNHRSVRIHRRIAWAGIAVLFAIIVVGIYALAASSILENSLKSVLSNTVIRTDNDGVKVESTNAIQKLGAEFEQIRRELRKVENQGDAIQAALSKKGALTKSRSEPTRSIPPQQTHDADHQ